MKYIVVMSILFFASACGDVDVNYEYSTEEKIKPSNESVIKAAYAFNEALIAKDTVKLNNLVCDEVSYGHSNGWIENKQELKADLFNNMLTYHKIEQPEWNVIIKDDIATLRGDGIFDVDYKDNEHMIFDLHVMQTWKWDGEAWQLINRQSVANKK